MEPAFREVCRSPDCMDLMTHSCNKILGCGHYCYGVRGETKCLPCLDENCVKKNEALTLGKTGNDYCTICQVEGLNNAPSVLLKCGHIFHEHCLLTRLKGKWPGPRIVFNYLECSECKAHIEAEQCPLVHNELSEHHWKF